VIKVREMVACLEDALDHPERLADDVERFQHALFEAPEREPGHEQTWRELEDLARELAWFVADEQLRREDETFLGPRRAVRRIRARLAKLDEVASPSPGGSSRR